MTGASALEWTPTPAACRPSAQCRDERERGDEERESRDVTQYDTKVCIDAAGGGRGARIRAGSSAATRGSGSAPSRSSPPGCGSVAPFSASSHHGHCRARPLFEAKASPSSPARSRRGAASGGQPVSQPTASPRFPPTSARGRAVLQQWSSTSQNGCTWGFTAVAFQRTKSCQRAKRRVCPGALLERSIQIILLISSRERQYNFEDLMSTRYPRCSAPAGRSAEPSVRHFHRRRELDPRQVIFKSRS